MKSEVKKIKIVIHVIINIIIIILVTIPIRIKEAIQSYLKACSSNNLCSKKIEVEPYKKSLVRKSYNSFDINNCVVEGRDHYDIVG